MPLTFILLQVINFLFAIASTWIHYKNPLLWDDQAFVLAVCGGTLAACLTAILLGLSLIFSENQKWGSLLIHLFLTLMFGGLQGYLLFLMSRDLGLIHLVKARLGLS